MRVESELIKSEVAWVSGWASDVSIWEDEIYERFPNYSHRFIDYSQLSTLNSQLSTGEIVLRSEIVVGWSMGTLVLLQNLQQKILEQKWFLICPIADFCAEGCWSQAALRATKQGVLQNTEQTLMSFSAMMGNLPKHEREKWVENAMRYSPKQLADGLDYLMEAKAEVKETENVKFIFGENDKIVPLAQKKLFPKNATVCENLGHWLPDYFEQISIL